MCLENLTQASHPLNIIRSTYQEGDLVVLKLDIDSPPLEAAITKRIEGNSALQHMAELLYEEHYTHRGGLQKECLSFSLLPHTQLQPAAASDACPTARAIIPGMQMWHEFSLQEWWACR